MNAIMNFDNFMILSTFLPKIAKINGENYEF